MTPVMFVVQTLNGLQLPADVINMHMMCLFTS